MHEVNAGLAGDVGERDGRRRDGGPFAGLHGGERCGNHRRGAGRAIEPIGRAANSRADDYQNDQRAAKLAADHVIVGLVVGVRLAEGVVLCRWDWTCGCVA